MYIVYENVCLAYIYIHHRHYQSSVYQKINNNSTVYTTTTTTTTKNIPQLKMNIMQAITASINKKSVPPPIVNEIVEQIIDETMASVAEREHSTDAILTLNNQGLHLALQLLNQKTDERPRGSSTADIALNMQLSLEDGTCLTFLYQEKFLPASDTGHNVRWLFQFEDRRLYFACIMILAHCGLDPYFALATNNMSDQIPCDQALMVHFVTQVLL